MTSSRLALAERAVRADPQDPDGWTRLAIEAARAGSEPDALVDPVLLESMVRAWLARPTCLELSDHVLPLVGLRVLADRPRRPGAWWAEAGRSVALPDLGLCARSGLPIHYTRLADRAEMLLVPWWGERSEPLRASAPEDADPSAAGRETPGLAYRPFLMDRRPIGLGEMLACDWMTGNSLFERRLDDLEEAERLGLEEAYAYCRGVRAELPTLAEWLRARTLGAPGDGGTRPVPEALVRAPKRALAAWLPPLPERSGAGLAQVGPGGSEWCADDWIAWMEATGRLRPRGGGYPRRERMLRARLRPVKHFLDELRQLAGLTPPVEIPASVAAAAARPEDLGFHAGPDGETVSDLNRWFDAPRPPPRPRTMTELTPDDPAYGRNVTQRGDGVDFAALEELLLDDEGAAGPTTTLDRLRRGTREF